MFSLNTISRISGNYALVHIIDQVIHFVLIWRFSTF